MLVIPYFFMLISDFIYEVPDGRRYDEYAGTTCNATRTTNVQDSCPQELPMGATRVDRM